jgi:hypothetical protein
MVLFALCCAGAAAGESSGYGFLSLDRPPRASFSDVMTLGGGGDWLFYKGLGIGADVGYQFARGDVSDGVGLGSLNGAYHFTSAPGLGGLVPFVTAGYAIAFRSGHLNLFTYGGGAQYWFHRRIGMRAELRDYRTRHGQYVAALRFGLTFR